MEGIMKTNKEIDTDTVNSEDNTISSLDYDKQLEAVKIYKQIAEENDISTKDSFTADNTASEYIDVYKFNHSELSAQQSFQNHLTNSFSDRISSDELISQDNNYLETLVSNTEQNVLLENFIKQITSTKNNEATDYFKMNFLDQLSIKMRLLLGKMS